jgi:lipoprotein-anchoring transpeptidase ErfK/SrfK
MHGSRSLLIVAALALAIPATAHAQLPTATPTPPPATTPVPTATPSPTPAAVPGSLRVGVKAPHRNRGKQFAIKGEKVRATGVLRPAVAGERVLVTLKHGHKALKTKRVKTAANGAFAAAFKLRASGRLSVRAAHPTSAAITRAAAKTVHIQSFAPTLNYGARGALLRLFQKGLARLKYPTSRSGVYDDATGRAVLAYRKVNSLSRVYTPNADIIRRVLAGKGGYTPRHPKAGHHVEADISRQFLALVDGDKVVRIEPVSSGKPSTPTVMGTYRFYSQTPGTNSEGMVYSSYFIRGYAIHGYADVPTYNASHGCLRIPIHDAVRVFDWINLGDQIFVEP